MVQVAPNPAEVGSPSSDRLYSLDALARRIQRVRASMDEKGVDGMLVSHPYNRNYISGFSGEDQPPLDTAGILLIGPNDLCLITDGRYLIQCAGELYPDLGIKVVQRKGKLSTALAEQITERKVKRLGFETNHLLHSQWQALNTSLQDTQLVPVTSLVEPLRMVKDADELRIMRQASAISDQAFNIVSKRIEAGMTEKQVAWDMEKTMRDLGADERAFGSIIGSGPNGAMAHAVPGDRLIQEGEPIVIDMGARLHGYNSDMTRTIILGEPTDKFREIYNIVLKANLEVERLARAGMTGVEINQIARDVVDGAGYGEKFNHGLGHGVGLEVHEGPSLSSLSEDTLRENEITSNEPGIYIEGWGGVRIEDLILFRPNDVEVLTLADKHLEY
jgi:Xaa-Pro aminopeptidase